MSPDALTPFFEEVEEAVHVVEVPPEARSRGTELFVEGAAKLGIEMRGVRRNTKGCEGRARCTFGCPVKAKMSVDVSYLPRAFAAGARLYSDCRVDQLITRGRRAVGVKGVVIGGKKGTPQHAFAVKAKLVFVCAGTIHTPLVLWRAGLGRLCPALGKHITLHPSFRLNAVFDEPVRGWDGAMQSVFSDHFMDDGLTLINVYSAVNVLAAAFPGVGKEHLRHIEKMPYTAMFGGMIHDTAEGSWGGAVHPTPGREPLITYKLDPNDKRRLMRGFRIVSEIAFAAGAKEVMLPWFGVPGFKTMREVNDAVDHPPPMAKIESVTFHPLGSARMGVNDRLGVVKTTGESWELDGLFIADGSVLPTSIGVNSQLPIMTVATKIARGVVDDWDAHAKRAAAHL
jgi:choline dehydrogenase-like flavoprotein